MCQKFINRAIHIFFYQTGQSFGFIIKIPLFFILIHEVFRKIPYYLFPDSHPKSWKRYAHSNVVCTTMYLKAYFRFYDTI